MIILRLNTTLIIDQKESLRQNQLPMIINEHGEYKLTTNKLFNYVYNYGNENNYSYELDSNSHEGTFESLMIKDNRIILTIKENATETQSKEGEKQTGIVNQLLSFPLSETVIDLRETKQDPVSTAVDNSILKEVHLK